MFLVLTLTRCIVRCQIKEIIIIVIVIGMYLVFSEDFEALALLDYACMPHTKKLTLLTKQKKEKGTKRAQLDDGQQCCECYGRRKGVGKKKEKRKWYRSDTGQSS